MFWYGRKKKEDTENQLEIELSTVQLFDLLETLDQFLADSSTLPHLNDSLSPVSRRYRQMEVSLVEQSTPRSVWFSRVCPECDRPFPHSST